MVAATTIKNIVLINLTSFLMTKFEPKYAPKICPTAIKKPTSQSIYPPAIKTPSATMVLVKFKAFV